MAIQKYALALIAMVLATPLAQAQAPFALEVVADGFELPLYATAPAGDPRLFVVEQSGGIQILEDGARRQQPFLSLADRISLGGEQGLLGLAFHPSYASNGRFFVNYTDRNGDTRVVEYRVSSDPNVADPAPVAEHLVVDQPAGNHNGGWIGFGPDGLLYVGMGDGGGRGDTQGNAQNDATLLGKIVRIDVDAATGPEVFAKGVRNPWRNAFDGETLYIADVGQNAWEEITVITLDDAGANLGWNTMEGFECFPPGSSCDRSGLTLPVTAYAPSEGCSITGGYVYRGVAIPAIDGLYFYSDYCSGILQSFRFNGEGISEMMSYADVFGTLGNVTSFGLDGAGEMYVLTQDGTVRRFVAR